MVRLRDAAAAEMTPTVRAKSKDFSEFVLMRAIRDQRRSTAQVLTSNRFSSGVDVAAAAAADSNAVPDVSLERSVWEACGPTVRFTVADGS